MNIYPNEGIKEKATTNEAIKIQHSSKKKS